MENTVVKNSEITEQPKRTKREAFIMWIKKNKKKLIAVGISLSAIAAAIIVFLKNGNLEEAEKELLNAIPEDEGKKLLTDLDQDIPTVVNNEDSSSLLDNTEDQIKHCAHMVSEHIRNLPEGYKASPEKIEAALQKGIELKDGQTLVDSYCTGSNVA